MALDIVLLRKECSAYLNTELAEKVGCSQSAISRVLDWKPGRQSKRMFRKIVVAGLGHDIADYQQESGGRKHVKVQALKRRYRKVIVADRKALKARKAASR